jgi:hypothetical protein
MIPKLRNREVVTDLIEEYKAAERPDYVTWRGPSATVFSSADPRAPQLVASACYL